MLTHAHVQLHSGGQLDRELLELVVSGPCRTIYAYRGREGQCPVLVFLEQLCEPAKARYLVTFRVMCDQGQLRGEKSHPLWKKDRKDRYAEELAEFKDNASKSRIIYFPEGQPGILVLAHAFGGKKERKIDQKEIRIAARVRAEYLERRDLSRRPRASHQRLPGGER